MIYADIPLLPTEWHLDLFIVPDDYQNGSVSPETRTNLANIMNIAYGANREYYYEEFVKINCVMDIPTTDDSKFGGHTRIVMVVNNDLNVIVHEIHHVVMHLSNLSGVEVNNDSQEWSACMHEYLFKKINEAIKNKSTWQ